MVTGVEHRTKFGVSLAMVTSSKSDENQQKDKQTLSVRSVVLGFSYCTFLSHLQRNNNHVISLYRVKKFLSLTRSNNAHNYLRKEFAKKKCIITSDIFYFLQ